MAYGAPEVQWTWIAAVVAAKAGASMRQDEATVAVTRKADTCVAAEAAHASSAATAQAPTLAVSDIATMRSPGLSSGERPRCEAGIGRRRPALHAWPAFVQWE